MLDSLALSVFNLDGKIRNYLADPNQALTEVLTKELAQKGANLNGIDLTFKQNNTLFLRMW